MSFIKKITMTAFALSFTMCLVPQVNATTITPNTFIGGNGVGTGESLASTRYRAFFTSGAQENYLGIPNLGIAANRVGQDINWGNLTTETFFDFRFQYDKTNDMLISILGNNVLQYTDWSKNLAARTDKTKKASDLNALQITIKEGITQSSVKLKSLVLDGISLGDLTGSDNANLNWLVTGPDLNLTDGFILSGQLGLQGNFGSSQEQSVVNLTAGWDERGFNPSQVSAPSAFGLMGLGLIGLMAARRRKQ